jgi:hypothetical protein
VVMSNCSETWPSTYTRLFECFFDFPRVVQHADVGNTRILMLTESPLGSIGYNVVKILETVKIQQKGNIPHGYYMENCGMIL